MSYHYRERLQLQLDQRKAKNRRYSLRSFAKSIGLDAGLLSKILAGKHIPSLESAEKIAAALNLNSLEAKNFLQSVAEERKTKQLQDAGVEKVSAREIFRLDDDIFATIAKLYHNAILEMTFTDDGNPDERKIARRLGITVIEAKAALSRLMRLGLIEVVDGRLIKTKHHLDTKDRSKTTPALREQQRDIFRSALAALDAQPLDRRSHSGITMALDPDKLPLAKTMIDDFLFRLCEFLESGQRKEVYQLGIALFSLEQA